MSDTASTSKRYKLSLPGAVFALLVLIVVGGLGLPQAGATHNPNICDMRRFARPMETGPRLAILTTLYQEGEECLFRVDPRTGAMQRLAKADEYIFRPTYSPNKMLVAFHRYVYREGSQLDLFVMNSDGTGEVRVEDNVISESFSWSPSSDALVVHTYDPPPGDISITPADGTTARTLPPPPEYSGWRSCPQWAPDGREISYHRPVGYYDTDLLAMDVATGVERTIVGGETTDGAALWSPDGERIAFARRLTAPEEAMKNDLFVVPARGGDPVAITRQSELIDRFFAWSPDGSKIVYTAYAFPQRPSTPPQLWVAASDGSWRRKLKVAPRGDEVTWSPSGRRIIFVRDRDLWSVRVDGTGARRITDLGDLPGVEARHPHWGSALSCYATGL